MSRWMLPLACLLCVGLSACAGRREPRGPDVIFFVPGAAGDGFWYDSMRRGLADAGIPDRPVTVAWGAPPPFTFLNFQDRSIHEKAEKKLARAIEQWAGQRPGGRIRLLAHSAGGGVALGALARLQPPFRVDQVVLLNPSVSPTYDLAPAAQRVRGQIHIFHSDKDALFLGWRCRTFGTYDNIKAEAAGKLGFHSARDLPPDSRTKTLQHAHDPRWESLGNDGDHFGPTARPFAAQVLAPLLK